MALVLKQSTAVDVLIGPFVDDTDGVTPEAALTLSQADIKLSKNGQTLAQKNDVTAAAADGSDGYYNCELDTTDTNTVGTLVLIVNESGALPVRHEFQVIEENVYDAIYGASAALGTNVASILTDTGTTLDGKLDTIDAEVGVIDANVDAILVDTAQIGAAGAGLTEAGGTGDHLTALASQASVDTVDSNVDAILVDTGTTLQAELDGIQADTEDIQSRLPAALVAGRMSSDMVALSGSTAAADNLEASALGVISGAAATGTLSTTQMTTDLSGYDNDRLIGRVIVFTSSPLAGEATDITDYVSASGLLTFTALTEAPVDGTTFVIV